MDRYNEMSAKNLIFSSKNKNYQTNPFSASLLETS